MHCRVCDSLDLSLVIDLKEQPWANHFLQSDEIGKEPSYPLRVVYCNQCSTAQLDFTVKKEVMFGNHTYLSGITKTLSSHFDSLATYVNETFCMGKKPKKALDIGSNDGTQLKTYKALGFEVLGVESAKTISNIANENGIKTLNNFFNLKLAKRINTTFDVINASGVFFHLEELHSVTDGITLLLKEDGVFVVQCLYMKSIMENGAFDQVYHEHLLYYTIKTLNTLLIRHGLSLFDGYVSPIHGGSFIGFASHIGKRGKTQRLKTLEEEEEISRCNTKEAYLDLAQKIDEMRKFNLDYLSKKKKEGKKIFGMGAPVKGNTLLNTFGINQKYLDCLVEKNRLRKGLYSPGSHLPIAIEDELTQPPDVYYVLAWNFKEEILKNNQTLIKQGVEFFFPVNPK